jgi:hypothetical protein
VFGRIVDLKALSRAKRFFRRKGLESLTREWGNKGPGLGLFGGTKISGKGEVDVMSCTMIWN